MHTIFKDSLTGKVALVTGAGSGIGKATAKLFAYAGARVAVLTRNEEEAHATCTEIRHAGGDAIGLVADVAKSDQLASGFQSIHDSWGRLDVVVANAGVINAAYTWEMTSEQWQVIGRASCRERV